MAYDYVAATAPPSPSEGETWWDTSQSLGFVHVGASWLPQTGPQTTIASLPEAATLPTDGLLVVHSPSAPATGRDMKVTPAILHAAGAGLPDAPLTSANVTFNDTNIHAISATVIPATATWIGVAPHVAGINRVFWCLRSQLFSNAIAVAADGDQPNDANTLPLETRDIAGVGAVVLGLHRSSTGAPLISWGGGHSGLGAHTVAIYTV